MRQRCKVLRDPCIASLKEEMKRSYPINRRLQQEKHITIWGNNKGKTSFKTSFISNANQSRIQS